MADRQKFRGLYAEAFSTLDRWHATQTRAVGLFASAVSILERLPLMGDDGNFGPLVDEFPDLPLETRVAQAEALHRVLESLAEELALFQTLVNILEKTSKDALSLINASKPSAAGGIRLGPISSPSESTSGLQDLARIHRDECVLKNVLVRELSIEANINDLNEACSLFTAEPNLDPEEIRVILDKAETLAADFSEQDFSPRKGK